MINKDLLGKLIGLVRCTEGNEDKVTEYTCGLILQGVSLLNSGDHTLCVEIEKEKQRLAPDCYACATPCGKRDDLDFELLMLDDEETAAAKEKLLHLLLAVRSDVPVNLLIRALFLYGLLGALCSAVQDVCEQLGDFADL